MATPATDQRSIADRYRLVTMLGRGGMGAVWKARDELLDRDVAVKEVLLPPELTAGEREVLRQRTLREARTAARLSHPAVVTVFDVVEQDGRPWIVMEFVPSRSLGEVINEDGPLSPERTAEIGLQVLAALRAAHRAGILHRDVKPSNVLLGPDGRVVLTDFGIATLEGDASITKSGILLGAPAYIAPERARGRPAGPESDLWSLGATLYTAVEGRAPHDKGAPMPTLTAVVTEEPEPARRAGPLLPVLTGLLRKDPAERLGTAEAERLLREAAHAAGGTLPGVPIPLSRPLPPDEGDGVDGTAFGGLEPDGTGADRAGQDEAERDQAADSAAGLGSVQKTRVVPLPPPGSTVGSTVGSAAAPAAPVAAGRPATPGEPDLRADSDARDVPDTPPTPPEPGGPESAAGPGETGPSPDATGPSPSAPDATPAEPTAAESTAEPGESTASRASDQHDGTGASGAAAEPARPGLSSPPGTPARAPAGAAASAVPAARTAPDQTPATADHEAVDTQAARGPAEPTTAAGRIRDPRLRLPLALLVVALLLITAGTVAWLTLGRDRDRDPDRAAKAGSGASATGTPGSTPGNSGTTSGSNPGSGPRTGTSAPPAATGTGGGATAQQPAVPPGFRMHKDPSGFSIAVPANWRHEQDGHLVYFREPNGARFMFIDQSDNPRSDPTEDWLEQERNRRDGYTDYRRIRIDPVKGYFVSASDWEFTHTASSGRRHVQIRGFVANKNKAYAIYLATPDAQWRQSAPLWKAFVETFKPAAS
jgi:hypothetical protein